METEKKKLKPLQKKKVVLPVKFASRSKKTGPGSDYSEPLGNEKHEKFCVTVSGGVRPTRAYQIVFNCQRYTSAATSACGMMHRPEIIGRIQYLANENADRGCWTRDLSIRTLRDIILDADTRPTEKIRAVVELNSMCGYHIFKSTQGGGNTNINNSKVMFLAPDGTDKPSEYNDKSPQNDKKIITDVLPENATSEPSTQIQSNDEDGDNIDAAIIPDGTTIIDTEDDESEDEDDEDEDKDENTEG